MGEEDLEWVVNVVVDAAKAELVLDEAVGRRMAKHTAKVCREICPQLVVMDKLPWCEASTTAVPLFCARLPGRIMTRVSAWHRAHVVWHVAWHVAFVHPERGARTVRPDRTG